MKRISLILILALLAGMLSGCCEAAEAADIAATTLPVYQFTAMLVEGTGLTVTRLVTESVSCLHDYSLNVRQVKAVESAKLIVMSGAGLEDFMADILEGKYTVDASKDIPLIESFLDHEVDSHIWLSPANAMVMATNIMEGLKAAYPQYAEKFEWNYVVLLTQLKMLLDYGNEQLSSLENRELLTFHDGFAYFAQCFELEILAAVEEESGSETSAHKLIDLIELVEHHKISAVFTETNGSDASAKVIAAETGVALYTLDMAMAGDDYFTAMYHNIDTIREALG